MEITKELIDGLALDQAAINAKIASELSVRPAQVAATVQLLDEGSTVPFISRYRKEVTGSLDEVQVRDTSHKLTTYRNLETRRLEIIRSIFEAGKLTEDLYDSLTRTETLAALEDIYAPFKKKKKTRGMIAREKGLEALARVIETEDEAAVEARAKDFVKTDAEHPELSVESPEAAIQGAQDIIAENLSQDPDHRAALLSFHMKTAFLVVKGMGDEAAREKSNYQMYWDYREPLSTVKPHRVLAVNRGEREGEIIARIETDDEGAAALLLARHEIHNRYHADAVKDGLERLLSPAVVRELRVEAAEKADDHGIGIFSENLRNLLMSPPIKGTRVLGMDPGIRTGTKCAALDETGKFLGYFVINQERDPEGARKAVAAAVKKYKVELIAVGNGTASQEVRKVVADALAAEGGAAKFTVVDEDGASVYSASDIAREEFPELDLTIRGAISIGRRLQDPLAELVKIDPKSIGVGLYQHDVNQKKLSQTLDEVVGSVVNNVGVNVNTASASLLSYVSGINAALAKKIVKAREEKGKILSRAELLNVPGMGPKTFEQCAGFLKIPESTEPLDNTWVHPENYQLAREILRASKSNVEVPKEMREELKTRFSVGDTTINDIRTELSKPNRDPRDELPPPVLQQEVLSFEDLKEGMKIKGKVKNVVDFGAFIDIGIKETGLLHVSEMAAGFVKDPLSVLKVGDVKEFRVIGLDAARRRISLSLKPEGSRKPQEAAPARKEQRDYGVAPGSGRREDARPRGNTRPRDDRPKASDTTYSPFADLLKKPSGAGGK